MIFTRSAREDELPAAYEFIDRLFGPGITPYGDVVAMQKHNPLFINIVTTVPNAATLADIFGYFSLVPLTEEAHALVAANRLHGSDMRPHHMPAPGERIAAIYMGAVAASERNDVVVRSWCKTLKPHALPLYTRPVTDDGARLCAKLGYRPVADQPAPDGRLNYVLKLA